MNTTEDFHPEWLTPKEAMQYLRCGKTSLYNVAKRYNIRATKLLSMTYFSREDIDRVMNENAVEMGVAA